MRGITIMVNRSIRFAEVLEPGFVLEPVEQIHQATYEGVSLAIGDLQKVYDILDQPICFTAAGRDLELPTAAWEALDLSIE